MGVRERIFGVLSGDPDLNQLGINNSNLYSTFAGESAPSLRFAVLRWGLKTSGVKRSAVLQELSLWVYDDDRDYSWINSVIKRWCKIMDGMAGVSMDDGWLLQADWAGDSTDEFDDVYDRITRSSSYILVITES